MVLEDDVTCTLTDDDALLASATFAANAMLSEDLDIGPVCTYLENGTGERANPLPPSTLWVLDIDPSLDTAEREIWQNQLRQELAAISADSPLTYGAVSLGLDLVRHRRINLRWTGAAHRLGPHGGGACAGLGLPNGTRRGLPAGRLVRRVDTGPMVCSTCLVLDLRRWKSLSHLWCLGSASTTPFTCSALTSRFERTTTLPTRVRACAGLAMPLVLAVDTPTVAAFLANAVSPLPPIATLASPLLWAWCVPSWPRPSWWAPCMLWWTPGAASATRSSSACPALANGSWPSSAASN